MAETEVDHKDPEEKALRDLRKAEADLERAQAEVREAERELAEARQREFVTLIVDGAPHRVRRGQWVVQELKAAAGVDAAKVLALITPQGLKDLRDDETIEVHESERFMSHARSGASS